MFRLPSDLDDHLRRGGTLVVPSRQRAYAVRLAHASAALAAGQRVWSSADVLSAESWLRREVERCAGAQAAHWPRLLTGAEEWFLWRQCAREATRELALLDGGALADSLREASELAAEFRIRTPAAAPESEAALLRQVGHALTERCRALGAAGVTALAERILEPPPGPNPPLLLRGFGMPTPRLRALMAARGAHDARGRSAMTSRPEAEPEVLRAADGPEELERIANWCRRTLERSADARLLVMLPGPPGARERLAALIRQAVEPASLFGEVGAARAIVGIEEVRPLAEQPMIRHALETLGWLRGAEGSFGALSAWLRAAHWTAPSAHARAALDLFLRARGFLTLDLRELLGALRLVPRELRGSARELSAQLSRAAAALGETPASPRAWSELVSVALPLAGWPGPSATGSDGEQTLVRWHKLLEEFGELTRSAGVLEREEALGLVGELATRSPLRPPDEDVCVTLSGRLTDPVIEYDGIWVGGLHADFFPQPVAPNPFLPLAAQIAAGVPWATAAGRLSEAQSLLAAWRAATSELVLSAPRHEKDMELVPSPLLSGSALRVPPEEGGWLPLRLHREGLTETLLDRKGRPWVPAQPLPRGTRSLDLQNQCPFRAYAELRLGSTRPELHEPGIAANRRGELLHAALAALWERLRDSNTLAELTPGRLEELIDACVTDAARPALAPSAGRRSRRGAESQLDMFAEIPAALARECRRAARLIKELCELERRRPPFRVTGTEQEAELALAGAKLRMRIDRVDALAGGGRAILDYKTGRRLVPDWYGERPTHPQLLAYLAALGEDVAALATVSVNAREVRFDAIAREAGLLPGAKAVDPEAGWAGQQAAWVSVLERLIGAFLEGDAAIEPKPGACGFCHVIDICRILERSGARALSEVGDE